MLRSVLFGLSSLSLVSTANAAAFKNLDFESATYKSTEFSDHVDAALTLPNWTVRADAMAVPYTQYGFQTTDGGTLVSVYSTYVMYSSTITGRFDVLLRRGVYGAKDILLSQTGDVASNIKSLRFDARGVTDVTAGGTSSGVLSLLVNGQAVPLIKLSQSGNDAGFAADLSAWAGQSAEISLHVAGGQITSDNPYGFGYAELDNFQLSSTPVPEPSILGMIGVLCLARRRASRLA